MANGNVAQGSENRDDAQNTPGTPYPLVDLASLDPSAIAHSAAIHVDRVPGPALRVHVDGSDPLAHLTIEAPGGLWDLSPYRYVAIDVTNEGDEALLVAARLNGDQWVAGGDVIPARGRGVVTIIVPRNGAIPEHIRQAIHNMNGLPEYLPTTISKTFDVRRVLAITLYVVNTSTPQVLHLSNLRAEGRARFPSADRLARSYFPLVDTFGQYQHDEWPTKVHSVAELCASVATEDADLAAHPGPGQWDQYGGWATGPHLEATGHFRTDRYRGRWWLVDPTGRLFWSYGVCGVRPSGTTPITDREHYFADLPPRDQYPELYEQREAAPFGYYANRPATIFDINAYNLMRKYGLSWQEAFAARSHRRLRSWGMNTMAGGTPESMYRQGRTPYAITIRSQGRSIEGTEGLWRKFPDPFDPRWRAHLASWLADEKDKSATDPYCIGYFVDNELSWNHDTYLARGVLLSPPDQPAKLALQDYLRETYGSIEALNRAWNTRLPDWGALLTLQEVPQAIDHDLRAFNVCIAEQYLGTCRDEIRRAAPHKLYMGARWDYHLYPHEDDVHRWVLQIAGRYCDVLSFNRYRYSCLELVPPPGVDLPIVISEWHIGTLERGMFHTGLRGAVNPAHEKRMYRHFLREALNNPYIVGAHWFQYGEQAVTGRFDGENYRIGFIDITDRPYQALVEASREVGYGMYALRF